ncbi:MarR family transcriptional regulator [Ramlibacter tataouinensis]|nr:MarR family transcriptional regulator [Ramlibacter tataouinensis]
MPLSVVHGCIQRAELAKLVSRASGSIRPLRPAVKEFVIHGAKYAFPAQLGSSTRGVPTAIGAPVLASHFEKVEVPPVWPSPMGTHWGVSVPPLHSAVLSAIEQDNPLYDALSLLDALRVGAAREREIALRELELRFG